MMINHNGDDEDDNDHKGRDDDDHKGDEDDE
jgi:hypothetical protein